VLRFVLVLPLMMYLQYLRFQESVNSAADYVAQDGRPVPSSVLEPDWEPSALRKKSRFMRSGKVTQDEQIQAAAAVVRSRDRAILQGDYARLRAAADRWQQVLSACKK
jgi:hypothetical protein